MSSCCQGVAGVRARADAGVRGCAVLSARPGAAREWAPAAAGERGASLACKAARRLDRLARQVPSLTGGEVSWTGSACVRRADLRWKALAPAILLATASSAGRPWPFAALRKRGSWGCPPSRAPGSQEFQPTGCGCSSPATPVCWNAAGEQRRPERNRVLRGAVTLVEESG